MEAAGTILLIVGAVLAGLATFHCNDGRDRQARATLLVIAGVGAVSWVLAFAADQVWQDAHRHKVPTCTYDWNGDELVANCEDRNPTESEAAGQSLAHMGDMYVLGPLKDFAASVVGATVGLVAAMLTGRRPPDGRRVVLLVDDDTLKDP